MNHYQKEISKLRKVAFPNQAQLDGIIRLRKFIDAHYQEDLTLNVLSAHGFVSKFHLLRLFKRYYGQTPVQYLTDRRLEASRACLRQGMNITETCYAVGFQSPSSFSTLFRRRMGISPAAFRKEQYSQSFSATDSEFLSST